MSPLFYITDNAVRLTVRPGFLLRKKRRFRHQRGTAANPLQYPSRLLFRASLRKPKNPVDSSPRFSSPKKTAFPSSTRHGSRKPLQYPSRLLLRISPRKPQNPVDSSSRLSSPKKTAFSVINAARQQNRSIPVPTSPPPHNQRLALFRLNFYAPYFLSAGSDFFPFLTKRFSGDGFSLLLVGKHQKKHTLQTKNDNGHFSVPVSAGQTFPGTLHPVNRIRRPVAAFSRQGANRSFPA